MCQGVKITLMKIVGTTTIMSGAAARTGDGNKKK